MDRMGLVGERTGKLLGYLVAVSRLLPDPLAAIIQSSSAAGKTTLMDRIFSLMPPEEQVTYSAMTGQSLYYMGEEELTHKVLGIVEEEGAERASYALKLLQSEGELTIASTGKDPKTGRLVTHEYRVEGPVAIVVTTTSIDVDEELENRALVLTVDETPEQTAAIHDRQRQAETLEGQLAARNRRHIRRRHHNAQRLLRPLMVVNPHAPELGFRTDRTRTRRDHAKFLTLIRTVALLRQYQRPVRSTTHNGERVEYIEATEADIAVASELAREVLGRSMDDLPPQTRTLLDKLRGYLEARSDEETIAVGDLHFGRREMCRAFG